MVSSSASQEPPAAVGDVDGPVLDHEFPARPDTVGTTADNRPLVEGAIAPAVGGSGGDGPRLVGIPENQVSVGAGSEATLAWEEAKDLGRAPRDQAHPLGGRHSSLDHARRVRERQPLFHARDATRNAGEVVAAEGLLRAGEGAVVGGYDVDVAAQDGGAQRVAMRRRTQRRAHDEGRGLVERRVVDALVEDQILGHVSANTTWPAARAAAIAAIPPPVETWTT